MSERGWEGSLLTDRSAADNRHLAVLLLGRHLVVFCVPFREYQDCAVIGLVLMRLIPASICSPNCFARLLPSVIALFGSPSHKANVPLYVDRKSVV